MGRLLAAALLAAALGGRALGATGAFQEDFGEYPVTGCLAEGATLGPWWRVVTTGFGCVAVETDGTERWLHASVRPADSRRRTHAVLVVGPEFAAPLDFQARVQTVAPTRVKEPNAWEAAWLVWAYRDNAHFYYFIPKRRGWELGKRDPAYPGGQRFLASGRSPSYPSGRWARIDVIQDQAGTICVFSDGRLVAAFTDEERPYSAGRIGFYAEDAHAHFAEVRVAAPSISKNRR